MLRIPVSLWLAAALVAAIHAGVLLIGRGSVASETKLPQRPLSELPNQLGSWQGRPVDPDTQVFQRLGAHSVVNRAYRDALGHEVVLHVALWSSEGLQLPHEPRMCYAGAGYEMVATGNCAIAEGEPSESTAHFLALQRGGERVYALYWYQFGSWTVADRNDLRTAIWHLRGQRQWPPLIKVLLQASEPKAEKAEEQLRSIAQPVLAWLKDLR